VSLDALQRHHQSHRLTIQQKRPYGSHGEEALMLLANNG
jgi:hypothetical protein